MNKYLIYLIAAITILSLIPSAFAWNVLFKSSGITTLWYYSNQSSNPIYIPVGFTNQSIYMVNIPPSLQSTVFTLSIAPIENGGFVSDTNKTITTFIPHGSEYVLPSFFFQESGEYYLSLASGQHSSFILFSRSTIPAQLYNSSASSIIVYQKNSNVSSLLEQLSSVSQNHTYELSSLTSQIKALEGGAVPTGNNSLFSWVLTLFFIILLIIIFLLYKRIKSLEEVNEVKAKYGDYSEKPTQDTQVTDDSEFDSKYSRPKKNDVAASGSENDYSDYSNSKKNDNPDKSPAENNASSNAADTKVNESDERSYGNEDNGDMEYSSSDQRSQNSRLYEDRYSNYGSVDKNTDSEVSQTQASEDEAPNPAPGSKKTKKSSGASGWSFERTHTPHLQKHNSNKKNEDSTITDSTAESADSASPEGSDDKGQYDSGITEED